MLKKKKKERKKKKVAHIHECIVKILQEQKVAAYFLFPLMWAGVLFMNGIGKSERSVVRVRKLYLKGIRKLLKEIKRPGQVALIRVGVISSASSSHLAGWDWCLFICDLMGCRFTNVTCNQISPEDKVTNSFFITPGWKSYINTRM